MDKKLMIFLAKTAVCTIILSVYAGAVLFFMDSFYYGTDIGHLNIGGYTAEGAEAAIAARGNNTTLVLYGRGAERQTIKGEDIQLAYQIEEDISQLKKQQPALLWPLLLFKKQEIEVTQSITYDERKLEEIIEGLSYFDEDKVVPPQDAEVTFNGAAYVIVPENEGRMLDKEHLMRTVIETLTEGENVLDLEKAGCYLAPAYRAESKELTAAQQQLNDKLETEIIYLFGGKEERVTRDILSSWLILDEEKRVTVDKMQISQYVGRLADTYNTMGITRNFKTSAGRNAVVSGGNYGWAMDQKKEISALIEAVQTGKGFIREPAAVKYGAESFIETSLGNSYVEISLTEQYLWFYKNGSLVTQGSIVTGTLSKGYGTPQGVYKLTYKQRNATLRGPGYATPVSFWMPFNGGIGIHDAVWRSQFGGSIYKNSGSHGCVNVPYSMAQIIFDNIDESIPIICYY